MIVAAAAVLGAVVGYLARRWTDREATAATSRWVHLLLPAVLCAAVAWRFGLSWDLPVYLYFALVSVPLAIIDLRAHRLPNLLTLSAYPIAAALLVLPAAAAGTVEGLIRAALGGAVLFAFYLVLHLVNPAGMGMGDVKLAGPMGALLGWLAWSVLLVGGFLGFAFGGLVGLGLLVSGRAGRHTALPFGPFMLAGAWVAILASETITGTGLLP